MAQEQELLDELAGVDADTPEQTTPPPEQPVPPPQITAEALKAAEDARIAAEAKLKELQDGIAKQITELRAERQKELEAARNPPPPKIEPPRFVDDPEGHIKAVIADNEKELTAALEAMSSKSEAERAKIAVQNYQTAIGQHELQFNLEQKDYYTALAHMRAIRMKELSLLFPQATADQVQKQIAADEFQMAVNALASGANPARLAYERAKLLGYSTQTGTPKGSDELPPDAEAERRVRASRAESMGGGGSPDLKALLDAESDDFASAFEELLGAKLH